MHLPALSDVPWLLAQREEFHGQDKQPFDGDTVEHLHVALVDELWSQGNVKTPANISNIPSDNIAKLSYNFKIV